MSLFFIIFLVIFALTIIRLLVTLIGPTLKGNLTLNLGPGHFRPGHAISGTLTLKAKKPLGPGHLVASLVCVERWEDMHTDTQGHRRRRTRYKEIYRQDIDVADGLTIAPGRPQSLPFVLWTPQPQDSVSRPPPPDVSGFSRALHTLAQKMPARPRDTYWKVEGRYDINGLDLKASKRIPLRYQPS